MTDHLKTVLTHLAFVLVVASAVPAHAANITVRLAVAHAPEEAVDLHAGNRDLGSSHRVTAWTMHATLNGDEIFRRVYKGQHRLFEKAEVQTNLDDGRYVLDPGNHVFTVTDGKPATTDPEIRIDGQTVSLLCYPVTVYAEFAGMQIMYKGKHVFEPRSPKYDPLTIYLPVSDKKTPYGLSMPICKFHVTRNGVTLAGKTPKWAVRTNKFIIDIPRFPYHVFGRGGYNTQTLIYHSRPYTVGEMSRPTDFDRVPERFYRLGIRGPRNTLYDLGVELPRRGARAGDVLKIRIPSSARTPTMTPAAFFAPGEMLGDTDDTERPWTRATLKADGENATLTVPPGLATGMYTLRIVLDEPERVKPLSKVRIDVLIGIAAAGPAPTITLFTTRAKALYKRGEIITVHAVLKSADKVEAGTLKLSAKQHGSTNHVPVLDIPIPAFGPGSMALAIEVNSQFIQHGNAALAASFGDRRSNILDLEIISDERATNFRIFTGGWNSFGWPWLDWLPAMHCNLTMATGNLNPNYTVTMPTDLRTVAASHLGLMAPELYRPTRPTTLAEETTRRQIDYLIRVGAVLDPDIGARSLAHSVYKLNLNAARRVEHLTQRNSRFASFLGYCHSDDAKTFGDQEEGDPHKKEKTDALKMLMPHRYGIDIPNSIITRDYVRASLAEKSSPEGMRARKERLQYIELVNSLFPTTHRIWNDRSRLIMPDMIMTTSNTWLGKVPDGFYLPKCYEQTDVLHTKFYADVGMLPFMDQFTIDLWRTGLVNRKKKFWYMLIQANAPVILREKLLSLSRKVDGLGYFLGLAWDVTGEAQSEIIRTNGMMERYGDFFMHGQPEKGIVMLYSYTVEAFNPGGFGAGPSAAQDKRLYEAYIACMQARRPAELIAEDEIVAGALKDYPVLILTNIVIPLPEDVVAAIEKYAADGGLVLMDNECTIPIKGARKIDDLNFRRWSDMMLVESNLDTDQVQVQYSTLENTTMPQIRELTKDAISPFADSDTSDLLTIVQDMGEEGKLVFAINNAHVPGTRYVNYVLPSIGEVFFNFKPGTYHVYDVLRGREVKVRERAGGGSVVTVDLSQTAGRVLLCTKGKLDTLEMKLPQTITAGSLLTITPRMKDSTGRAVLAALPVELTVRDPTGKVQVHGYRAYTGKDSLTWQMGLDARPGAWSVELYDMVTGQTATGTVNVTAPKTAAKGAARASADTLISGGAGVMRFIKVDDPIKDIVAYDDRAKIIRPLIPKLPIIIAVDRRQADVLGYVELAQKIKDALGDRAEIFIEKPHLSLEDKCTGRRHIVFSVGHQSEMVAYTDKHDIALVRVTPSYPGRGRGLIRHVWSVQGAMGDRIELVGGDRAGLEKAVATLVRLDAEGLPPAFDRRPQPAAQATVVAAVKKVQAYDSFNDTIGVSLNHIAFSADGRIAVLSAAELGENMFAVNDRGQLKWHRKVYRLTSEPVRVFPGGDVITADKSDGHVKILTLKGKGRWKFKGSSFTRSKTHVFIGAKSDVSCLTADGTPVWTDSFWEKARTLAEYNAGGASPIRQLFVTADGTTLLALRGKNPSSPAELHAFDAATGKTLYRSGAGTVLAAHFDASRNVLTLVKLNVVNEKSANLEFTRQKVGPKALEFIDQGSKPATDRNVRISRDGGAVISPHGDWGEHTLVWYIAGANRGKTTIIERIKAKGVNVAPDGRHIVAANASDEIIFYTDGKEVWRKRLKGDVTARFTPDGQSILAVTSLGWVVKFDLKGKKAWQTRIPSVVPPNLKDMFIRGEGLPLKTERVEKRSRVEQLRAKVPLVELSTINPDFEDGIIGWKFKGKGVISTDDTAGGKRCLKLTGSMRQAIEPNKGEIPGFSTLAVAIKYRSDDPNAMVELYVDAGQPISKKFKIYKPGWHEGMIVFKAGPDAGYLDIIISTLPGNTEVIIDDIQAFRLKFPYPISYVFVEEAFDKLSLAQKFTPIVIDLWSPPFKPQLNVFNFLDGRVGGLPRKWFTKGNSNRWVGVYANLSFQFPEAVPVTHVAVHCDPARPKAVTPTVIVTYLREDGEFVDWPVAGAVRWIDDTYFVVKLRKPVTTKQIRIHQLDGVPDWINCWSEVEIYGPYEPVKEE